MECCGMPLKTETHILTADGFIAVTPFLYCSICKEEYYNIEQLTMDEVGGAG